MKRIFYYTTTALVLSCGITQAQTCVPTPTCSSLGYTSSTACDGGLKCPFGNYWYCQSNSGGECADFSYTCFGRGYVEAAGIGADCNGKYVKCECYAGYLFYRGRMAQRIFRNRFKLPVRRYASYNLEPAGRMA